MNTHSKENKSFTERAWKIGAWWHTSERGLPQAPGAAAFSTADPSSTPLFSAVR